MSEAKIAEALERIAAAAEQIATLMTKQGIKALTEPAKPVRGHYNANPPPEPANGQQEA